MPGPDTTKWVWLDEPPPRQPKDKHGFYVGCIHTKRSADLIERKIWMWTPTHFERVPNGTFTLLCWEHGEFCTLRFSNDIGREVGERIDYLQRQLDGAHTAEVINARL